MGSRSVPPIRSLPRFFLPGADAEAEVLELPEDELTKIRKVLRMSTGDPLAILPNDGKSIWRCTLDGRSARVDQRETIDTEPELKLTLAQAFPRPEKLEEVVRMGTELGVARFIVFPTDRSVVRWDQAKLESRLKRLRTIIQEAAEVAFRAKLPDIVAITGLQELLQVHPDCIVLSETEGLHTHFDAKLATVDKELTIAIGPEGGWSPREVDWIGDRAATLGKRVFRVDTAAVSAASLALLRCR
ncbi:MAG: 16S rRNA (uracil(1498)-N(3))-methyltransferase [Armatimonadetes bacterium]|nr:16S rRNA (uracil(1498)-N(3))-methyltransferase [Armatimonadota bacterium]